MTTATLASPTRTNGVSDIPDLPIWRLSVSAYHAMIDSGILGSDDPVELLEGWLVTKMSKNPPHRVATGLIHDALLAILPPNWFFDVQDPVTTDDSEPEPDLSLIRGTRRQYTQGHPIASDTALVIEVSDTTLYRDRGTKKRIYARAGFPEYWIVNLNDEMIEVYTLPSGPTSDPDYGNRQDYGAVDTIPLVLDGVEVGRIAVKDVLP